MVQAVESKDNSAVKKTYDYQYSQKIDIYKWDLEYKDLIDIEIAEI